MRVGADDGQWEVCGARTEFYDERARPLLGSHYTLFTMSGEDPYDLQRFVDAQDGVWDIAVQELRAGRKRTHWMWFIFPQIQGLGHSAMAERYAITSLEEARAYLAHSLLGARLEECTRLVNGIEERTIEEIFGYPDYLKFHSSMMLFVQAAPMNPLFNRALTKYFRGQFDPGTTKRLSLTEKKGKE
jgi:uncharacterized protein (DUF1810 family)